MLPQKILIKEFNYHLPEERIAIHPLPERDKSKLLVYKSGKIEEHIYNRLADCLPAESLLVFNNTKVMAVRLLFTKHTGSIIELFCLEPAGDYPDVTTAMLQKGRVLWKCLVGGAKKWKEETLTCSKENIALTVKKAKQEKDYFVIEFTWNDTILSFADVLQLFGTIPLPPYLNRAAEQEDEERYQTIYARYNGSVAAPTAGLHFTNSLFNKLEAKSIRTYIAEDSAHYAKLFIIELRNKIEVLKKHPETGKPIYADKYNNLRQLLHKSSVSFIILRIIQ